MFWSVVVIGGLTLATDVWRAQQWLVPEGYLFTAATWQALLGLLLLMMFLLWAWFAFIRPPVFGRRNAIRYLRALYRAILNGSSGDLAVVADELSRSVHAIIHHAPEPDRHGALGTSHAPSKRPTIATQCANDILLLIGDRRFCRAIVDSAPGTILRIFDEIARTEKYGVQVQTFARNVFSEALANRNSFLYHETEGYYTGLIGYHKPITQAMFANSLLVGEIGILFDPDFTEMRKWDATQWSAYCRAVLMTLRDYVRRGLSNHPFLLYGALDHIQRASSDLYKLNGAASLEWDSEAMSRLRVVIEFFKDAIKILEEVSVPNSLVLRVREKGGFGESVYDHLAEAIVEVVFDASAVRSPIMLCWVVQHNTVWGELFDLGTGEGPASRIIQFKVRRLLYNEIKQMKEFPNYKGAGILGFCLNVLGLRLREQGYLANSQPLQKAVLAWTRCNFAWLHTQNPELIKACLVDGFTYQPKRLRIVKTYPADGLSRAAQYEYFEVLPPAGSENKQGK